MNEKEIKNVGPVKIQNLDLKLSAGGLVLHSGESLSEVRVAYETYGELSSARDNVIFVCHALTGDAHAAGVYEGQDKSEGWWDNMIGPGKGIDTRHYHVICANILGGCKGTTGPSSVNPATGKAYGSAFPRISVCDIVKVHKLFAEQLGLERLAAVIGGSLGGMQVLEWARSYPESVDRAICIASGANLSTQGLAFDAVGRDAICSDPNFKGGDYYESGKGPDFGLALARQIGHITYISPESIASKFGREKTDKEAIFQVQSYLRYQAEKFLSRFDANSYLSITDAMDQYDLALRHGSLAGAFEPVQAKVLVVALASDTLFPPEQSVEVANALLAGGKKVSFCRLEAPYGHDAFLVDIDQLSRVISAFLPWVNDGGKGEEIFKERFKEKGPGFVKEAKIIAGMVEPGAKVLDLGCGDGELLTLLKHEKNSRGLGVDIDIDHVVDVLDLGREVFQADIDTGLAMIPDGAYDYAILDETLQVIKKPSLVLRELLRVAREGIISFPNFGYWSNRVGVALGGHMPKSSALPFEWYDTPYIHYFTLADFVELCKKENIRILDISCIANDPLGKALVGLGLRNLGADTVLVKISRGG